MFANLLLPLILLSVSSEVEQESPLCQAAEVVARQVESVAMEKAILSALGRHPRSDRWSGNTEQQVFGIVVVPFTDRDVQDGDLPMFRKTAGLLASKEMLLAKVFLDRYAALGLTDSGTLREAILTANESLAVHAMIEYALKETSIQRKHIVGIAIADREKIATTMTGPTLTNSVCNAYRKLVRMDTAALIQKQKFESALLRLQELRKANLFDQECLIDVLQCFVGLDQSDEAGKIVENFVDTDRNNLALFLRLAEIVSVGQNAEFQELNNQLQKEIERLTPPEKTMEETLEQLLIEYSN